MIQYLEILQEIFDKGTKKSPARENMPYTVSRFSIQKRFDLSDGFPLVTTKKMFYKGMIHELIWFLRGDTNIYYLHANGVKKFWHEDGYKYYLNVTSKKDTHVRTFDEWCSALNDKEYADIFGELGLIYSHHWRNFTSIYSSYIDEKTNKLVGGIDQIGNVLNNIKKSPESRYHVVTAWNPSEISSDKCALPPCHMLFMMNCRKMTIEERFEWWSKKIGGSTHYFDEYIRNHDVKFQEKYLNDSKIPEYWLDLDLTQRSCDTPLGVPVNIASYALMLEIFAKLTNMAAGEFIWCGKDVHIYANQMELAKEQLLRKPKPLPRLEIVGDWKTIDDIKYEDFIIHDYQFHPLIEYPLSTGIKK